MKINTKKGFTLIELLVVIAIIGILASVVLSSLNTARGKGGDAAVKSNLNGIRSQAEIYYDSNTNSYAPTALATTTGSSCTGAAATSVIGDTNVKAAIAAAVAQAGSANLAGGTGVTIACAASPSWWMIAVPYKSDPSKVWCVSSSGVAKEVAIGSIDTAAKFTLPTCQ